LGREDLARIVVLQLAHLQSRLAARDIKLTVSKSATDRLARDGYDPTYGARPLKRLIQQEIENPLAKRLLSGEFGPGDNIEVDASGEGYQFKKLNLSTPKPKQPAAR
jgi:ATP-dependent Clp protease ATP-binding subunit ClpB